MSKVKEPAKPYTGEILDVGTSVKILKGLWTNATGIVKAVDAKTGVHLVFIEALDGKAYPSGFHCESLGSALDVWI